MGNSIESDIYFGSSKGTISLYTNHKHFFMKEKAHIGSINCIKITDVFNQTVCVLTAGEDGYLKIWSPRIELLQSIDVKSMNPTPDMNNPRAYGIQSLDIYTCDKNKMATILLGI